MFMLFDSNKQRLAGGPWCNCVRATLCPAATAPVRSGPVVEVSVTPIHPTLRPLRPRAVGDIYPEAVQLKKGDHVIRVLLRHDDAGLLEKMKVRVGGRQFNTRGGWIVRLTMCDFHALTNSQYTCACVCVFATRRPCRWWWNASWKPRCRWGGCRVC